MRWLRRADTDPAHVAASARTIDRLDSITARLDQLKGELEDVVAELREESGDGTGA